MTALTEAEKVEVRRHCGYPAQGAGSGDQGTGRYFQALRSLEFRVGNLSDPELAVVRRYLTTLTTLEAAIPDAAGNLDTDEAAVWTRNRTEVADRLNLLDEWRRRLCGFIGIQTGPALARPTSNVVV